MQIFLATDQQNEPIQKNSKNFKNSREVSGKLMWLPSSLSLTEKDLKKYAIIRINLLRKIFKSLNIIFFKLVYRSLQKKKTYIINWRNWSIRFSNNKIKITIKYFCS